MSRASSARRYLVTGGAGFIGSHLTERLLAESPDNLVVVVDNLSTGRISNLEHVLEDPRLRFVQGSILDEVLIDELVHQTDQVVHLAAAVGVKLIMEQPLRSFTTNIRGTEIILEAAHRYRRPILLASTSEIYGKNYDAPLSEDADRVLGSLSTTRWSYATSKAVDEILAYCYHRERGLHSVVLRLFNTVGPRQSPAYGMVIPRLVRQALSGEPLTIHGDGQQSRCFVHVSDVIEAIVTLLDSPDVGGEMFNVGGAEEISIENLARLVLERTGSASTLDFISYLDAYGDGFEDMRRRVPDTTKIREAIGWEPTRSLVSIVDDVVADANAEFALSQPTTGE